LREVRNNISHTLNHDSKDLPFALYYSLNENLTKASLMINTHDLKGTYAKDIIELGEKPESIPWPFQRIIKDHKPVVIENFQEKYFRFECAWGDIVEKALVIPVFKTGQEVLHGIFIAAISPRLTYDEDYQGYLNLLIGQINLAITNLHLYENEKELLNRTELERKNLYKVLMQAPVPVSILKGPDHVFDLVNTLYQRLFGKRQILKMPFIEALPELKNQGVYELLDNVYRTGETYIGQELKFDLSSDTGSPLEQFYFTFIMEALRDDNNHIIGIIILCYEVTPQVIAKQNLSRYNAELSEKNKELIKVNADLDNFVYTASHDLKAPVSNLEGLFNTLMEQVPANEDIKNIKALIEKSLERFRNTIDDLTEISKAQKGDLEEKENVILSELLDEVCEGIRDQIQSVNGKVNSDFEVAEIRFSKKNLRSVLYNLISNGIKYSRPGVSPVINISTRMDQEYIVMTIADNGLGIASENKDKIFQMFKRVHVHVEGTGVGLYIVKRILENAGGKIEVESEIGKGSIFRLYFPITVL
jgi:signal transduction histidine kinase